MTTTIIALDLGTTSCRAILFGSDGKALAQVSQTYPLHTPHPGWVVQDPDDLLSAADTVVAGAARKAAELGLSVSAISLCTYMHSLIAVGSGGKYQTNVITWADTRSAAEVDWMRSRPDWKEFYARTGCPPHTMYPLYRYLWFRKNDPGLLDRAERFLSIKELLVQRWTGERLLDYNLATGTGLFNELTLDWDEEALELVGIHRNQLPEVVPTTHTLPLTYSALGLPTGTPVVVGAGDGVLSSLGVGAIEPNVIASMVGTSGALRACVPEPTVDPQARVFCYYLDKNRWILGGSLNNGGIALRWLRDNFYPGSVEYDDPLAEAATVPPGAGSLLFLPYLAGERSPGFNARARGVWFGLGLEHKRPHMARSVLEAIAYRLYSVLGPIEELTGPAKEIRATGGYARSQFWLQICADVFGREVTVPASTEGSALGAFVLANVALGAESDLSMVHRLVSEGQRLQPNMQNHELYQEFFAIYQRVSRNLQSEFYDLAALRERGQARGATH